jgi:hypothetical protein
MAIKEVYELDGWKRQTQTCFLKGGPDELRIRLDVEYIVYYSATASSTAGNESLVPCI